MKKNDESSQDNNVQRSRLIRGRFRTGAKWLVARRIWTTVEENLQAAGSKVLKSRLKLDNPAQVARLKNGTAGMEHYVCAMAEAETSFSETGEFPASDELAVSGYQAAVLHQETGRSEPTNDDVLVSETAIIAIFLAVRSQRFRKSARLQSHNEFSDTDWEEISMEISEQLKNFTGRAIQSQRLKEFVFTWGAYVVSCRNAIPYRWLAGVEDPIS